MSRCFAVSNLVAGAIALALATLAPPAGAQCTGLCWTPRGSYSFIEFTGLYTVPGYPCVVAWTGLSNGGLKVSTDCGQQFASLVLTSVYDVTARDPEVGYVAAGSQGVIKTVDGGGNWFQTNAGLPLGANARSVVIHLGFPDSAFAGFHGAGVYRGGPISPTDSLMQWTPMNEGLLDLSVRTMVRVRGGTFMLIGTNSGIWRRTNNVWSNTQPGIVVNAFVIDSADSNRCYAAAETGLYRSLNGGLSWTKISNGLPNVPINDVARRTDNTNILYVGTRGQGVYESVDQGASWHKFGPDLPGENDARAVLCVTDGSGVGEAQVFAGTRINGLFEATYSTPAVPTTWGQVKGTYRH
jgi:photosystem II stability/assembly factor-like uncharacterized protein